MRALFVGILTLAVTQAAATQESAQAPSSKGRRIEIGGIDHRYIQLQLRALLERRQEICEPLLRQRVECGASGREIDLIHLLAAAEQAPEQRKRCCHDLRQ